MTRRSAVALLASVLLVGAVGCGRAGDGPEAALIAPSPAPIAEPVVDLPSALAALDSPWLFKSQEKRPPQISVAADAVVSQVAIFPAPGAPEAMGSLSNPTHERKPLVMKVLQQQGEWLYVQIPVRPNGSTAWVRAADVATRLIPNRIVIELGARRITVYDPEGVALLQEPVAIGQARYPTPVGDFFLDVFVKDPGGAYGAYQLSVAGFSDVLMSFGGGNGQIAIHGTNQPQLIGQAVSHGCIRMTNEAITRLAGLAPMGTPVSIVA